MKKAHLILLAIVFIVFGCKKEEESCDTEVSFELSSTAPASIDSVKFLVFEQGQGNRIDTYTRILSNLILPYEENTFRCNNVLEYNLRCYDSDTSIVLTLKVFKDGVLRDQITASPNDSVVLSGGF